LDQAGRVVVQQENFVSNSKIDISHLNPGCYFLLLNNQNKSITVKLIKA
jgi:hypothetical protein